MAQHSQKKKLSQLQQAGLFVLTVLVLFFTPGNGEDGNAIIGRLSDAAHYPIFFLLTLWLIRIFRQSFPSRIAAVRSAIFSAALLAVLIEYVQPYVQRSSSLADALFGICGVVIAALWLRMWEREKRIRPSFICIAGIFFFATMLPPYLEWSAFHLRQKQFPLLGDFEHRIEQLSWQPEAGDDRSFAEVSIEPFNASSGTHALRITTAKGSWSGVKFGADLKDWSSFAAVEFSVFNPSHEFLLTARIDDRRKKPHYDERINESFLVPLGWSRFRIALRPPEQLSSRRPFNFKKIRALYFFTGHNEPSRNFFLDDIRLVKISDESVSVAAEDQGSNSVSAEQIRRE